MKLQTKLRAHKALTHFFYSVGWLIVFATGYGLIFILLQMLAVFADIPSYGWIWAATQFSSIITGVIFVGVFWWVFIYKKQEKLLLEIKEAE